MKKAFTIIEILFAMFLIALLSAIALPNFYTMTDTSYYKTMKSDANGANQVCKLYYQDNFNYNNFVNFKNNYTFEDTDGDGISDLGGVNNDGKIGTKSLFISEYNKIIIKPKKCDSSDDDYSGYIIKVRNSKVSENKEAYFDSCIDMKPYLKNY